MISENYFERINSDDSDRDLQQGEYRVARNLLPVLEGLSQTPRMQTIPGTREIENANLPSGDNKCIGWVEDKEKNLIFYMVYNSLGNHCIFEYNPVSDVILLVLQNTALNFQENKLVTGGGVADGVLYFSDGFNEIFSIDVERAKSGDFDSVTQELLTLIKPMPLVPPTFTINTDANLVVNRILDDSFQFAVRYRYLDNTFTPFSPLSILGNVSWDADAETRNFYTVSHTIESDVRRSLKQIEFAYVRNNIPEYYIFSIQDIVDSDLYTADFYNNNVIETVSEDDALLPFQNIPRRAEGFDIFRNRAWAVETLTDYDVSDSVTLTLTPSRTTVSSLVKSYKGGGRYKWGVVWYDKYGRSSGVTNTQEINLAFEDIDGSNPEYSIDLTNSNYQISATLAGTAPEWAVAYQIVRTINLNQQLYAQVPANVLFWLREANNVALANTEFQMGEQVFLDGKGGTTSTLVDPDYYDKLVLQIPINAPIIPDQNWVVKLISTVTGATEITKKIEKVIDGEFLFVDGFGLEDWTSADTRVLIEYYSTAENQEEIFYEVGLHGTVTSGVVDAVSGNQQQHGDTFWIGQAVPDQKGRWVFNHTQIPDTTDIGGGVALDYSATLSVSVNSPTPYFSGEEIKADDNIVQIRYKELNKQYASIDLARSSVNDFLQDDAEKFRLRRSKITSLFIKVNTTVSLDYSKIASAIGRANIELPEQQEIVNTYSIRYSNTFVQGAQFNGLGTFLPANVYTLPLERGPVRSLVGNEGNVLVAIHEKEVSSLYVGETIIQSNDGEDTLTKTDSVVGTDRKMMQRYGTIDPESVVEHDGRIYFYDRFNAEFVRYAQNGLQPLARTFKNVTNLTPINERSYATARAEVVTGYDPYSDIVYLSPRLYNEDVLFEGTVGADSSLVIPVVIESGGTYVIEVIGAADDEVVQYSDIEPNQWIAQAEQNEIGVTTGTILMPIREDNRYKVSFDTDQATTITFRLGTAAGTIVYNGAGATTATEFEFVADGDYPTLYYSVTPSTDLNIRPFIPRHQVESIGTSIYGLVRGTNSSTTLIRNDGATADTLFVNNTNNTNDAQVTVRRVGNTPSVVTLNPELNYNLPYTVRTGETLVYDYNGGDTDEVVIGYSEAVWSPVSAETTATTGGVTITSETGITQNNKYRIRFRDSDASGSTLVNANYVGNSQQAIFSNLQSYEADRFFYFEAIGNDTGITVSTDSGTALVTLEELTGEIADQVTLCNIDPFQAIYAPFGFVSIDSGQFYNLDTVNGWRVQNTDTPDVGFQTLKPGDTVRFVFFNDNDSGGTTNNHFFRVGIGTFSNQFSASLDIVLTEKLLTNNVDIDQWLGAWGQDYTLVPDTAKIVIDFTVTGDMLEADGINYKDLIVESPFESFDGQTVWRVLRLEQGQDPFSLCQGTEFTADRDTDTLYIDTNFLTENAQIRIRNTSESFVEQEQETWAFSELRKGWIGKFDIFPERFGNVNDKFYSWNNGIMYQMNADESKHGDIYGLMANPSITFVANESAPVEKVWQHVAIDSNEPWDIRVQNTDQDTDLLETELSRKENMYYGNLRRDKNTPADQLGGSSALFNGRVMQSKTASVTISKTLEMSETEKELNSVFVGYSLKTGHLIGQKRK